MEQTIDSVSSLNQCRSSCDLGREANCCSRSHNGIWCCLRIAERHNKFFLLITNRDTRNALFPHQCLLDGDGTGWAGHPQYAKVTDLGAAQSGEERANRTVAIAPCSSFIEVPFKGKEISRRSVRGMETRMLRQPTARLLKR